MKKYAEKQVPSPFGGTGRKVLEMHCDQINAMYHAKCGVDVGRSFAGLDVVTQYECDVTGMMFWRPAEIAGDEAFYVALSQNWPNYYKTDRWEYRKALAVVSEAAGRVLEVGCGRGYFLRQVEQAGCDGVGLELNGDAIQCKVTQLDIYNATIESFRAQSTEKYSVVCSFQVLEHVVDPAAFIRECASLLEPGGRLIFSTPNQEFDSHEGDAFDLPPHHMNQFTPVVFERIAQALGMEVRSIDREPWERPRFSVYSNPAGGRFNQSLRSAINRAAKALLGVTRVAGPSPVCVLRSKS